MEQYAVPNKLPAKQVSILARRKTRIDKDKNLAVLRKKQKHSILKKKIRIFKKAEYFVAKFLKSERDENRVRRHLLNKRSSMVKSNTNNKLILVMRHRARDVASPIIKKILMSLRLERMHSTVFLEMNSNTAALLPIIEPYVVWGTPNINTIRELLFKFGKIKVNGESTSIQSNTLIEEQFGDVGIICVEDIVHEIVTVGENFERVNELIYPFILKQPRDGWKKKLGVSYEKGGEFGNRGAAINELISRCI